MTKNKRKTRQEEQDAAQPAMEQELTREEAVEQEDAQTPAQEAPEEDAPQQPDADPAMDALTQELAQASAKADEYLNLAQRVQADFDNFRRRNQNVRHDAFEEGARAFAATLLPVIDNLERAVTAAKETSDPSLREGVEMVLRQMTDVFGKRGIQPIDRKGEPFDPTLENAVMQGASEDGEPGTVCEVFQKGYQMDGVVLRHAMVKVVPQ